MSHLPTAFVPSVKNLPQHVAVAKKESIAKLKHKNGYLVKPTQRKIYLCGLKIDLTHIDSPKNAETIDNKSVEYTHVDSHLPSHLDSFYPHTQTHIDSPPPPNNSLFNQKSSYERSKKDQPENNQCESTSESTSESKVSQEVSQEVSQQKTENPNKINGFKKSGESTIKNEVSQNFGIDDDDDELNYPEKGNDLKLLWEVAKMGGHNRETLIKYIEEKLNQPIKESRQLTKNQILYLTTNLHYEHLKTRLISYRDM